MNRHVRRLLRRGFDRFSDLARRSGIHEAPVVGKALVRVYQKLASYRVNHGADIYLLSFPKCGRTWLTLLIGRALTEHAEVEIANEFALGRIAAERTGVPEIQVSHDDNPQFKAPWELEGEKLRYRRKKVIFLVRDPRDVLVSWFFHRTRRRKDYEGNLKDFVYEERGSTKSLIRFYNLWLKNRGVPEGFLLVRYEDLQEDAVRELGRVLDFMEVKVDRSTIRKAVDYADFDNMRRMERANQVDIARLTPGDRSDPESYKTRRGRVGGYVDYLSDDEIRYLDGMIEGELDRSFGYRRQESSFPRVSRS